MSSCGCVVVMCCDLDATYRDAEFTARRIFGPCAFLPGRRHSSGFRCHVHATKHIVGARDLHYNPRCCWCAAHLFRFVVLRQVFGANKQAIQAVMVSITGGCKGQQGRRVLLYTYSHRQSFFVSPKPSFSGPGDVPLEFMLLLQSRSHLESVSYPSYTVQCSISVIQITSCTNDDV